MYFSFNFKLSISLHYILYDLGTNQDIQNKLYDEISFVIKNDDIITSNHINGMKYLKFVVKESMR